MRKRRLPLVSFGPPHLCKRHRYDTAVVRGISDIDTCDKVWGALTYLGERDEKARSTCNALVYRTLAYPCFRLY